VGIYLGLLGMAALPAGEYEDAYSWLQEALDIFHSFAMRGEQARTEPVAGLAAQRMGQPDRAREHLVEALRLGRELDSWPPVALALPAIALLLADRGQIERAVELYALASRYPYVANSRWFEDVAGREISALTATLPPEVVAAAQARGRARDLWATAEELLAELGG
jgi:tetratricopeptide (TPR) repeat protein